jgi:hypothetical protein
MEVRLTGGVDGLSAGHKYPSRFEVSVAPVSQSSWSIPSLRRSGGLVVGQSAPSYARAGRAWPGSRDRSATPRPFADVPLAVGGVRLSGFGERVA